MNGTWSLCFLSCWQDRGALLVTFTYSVRPFSLDFRQYHVANKVGGGTAVYMYMCVCQLGVLYTGQETLDKVLEIFPLC